VLVRPQRSQCVQPCLRGLVMIELVLSSLPRRECFCLIAASLTTTVPACCMFAIRSQCRPHARQSLITSSRHCAWRELSQPSATEVVVELRLDSMEFSSRREEEYEFYHQQGPAGMAGRTGSAGDGTSTSRSRDCAILIVIFAAELRRAPRWAKGQALLRAGVVGIATGNSDHRHSTMPAVSLTHTPSPMGFLNDLLGRPCPQRPS